MFSELPKKKVLLRAPLLTNSGYGVHSRQVFSWLYGRSDVDLTVECLNWGMTSWMLDENEEHGLIGKIMQCSKPATDETFDMSFQVQLPDEWDPNAAKYNVGITALVETDRCNPEWVKCCNQMDHIVVPSTFTKNVLKRSGIVMKPVSVVPEWYNADIMSRSKCDRVLSDDRFDVIEKPFNILIVGTLTSQDPLSDRKNLVNTIKWALEEFKEEKDVGVILKTSFGKGTTADKKMCKVFLRKLKSDLGYKKEEKLLHLLHGNMSAEEVAALYNHTKIKMYATATRGEGYGLPLIEAAVAGLPIVATNWSGHLEFLDREHFGAVDYDLVEINENRVDDRIFKPGFRWANPSEHSFKSEIRKVYDDYASAKSSARLMMKKIRVDYSSASIKNLYNDLFLEKFKQ